MYCGKMNQVVISTATAVPNVIPALEQIITALSIFYAVIDPEDFLFSIPGNREN